MDLRARGSRCTRASAWTSRGRQRATVNGQKVAVDEQGEAHSTQFTVLPGDYAVAVSSTSKYVTYGGAAGGRDPRRSAPLSSGMAFQKSFTPRSSRTSPSS
ncbi:hypothetical protein QJS66_14900 [Kocuria rhizophila]|nr:hypothetical protein QJS66_14900 [Kocuria rhizophila]